jgi:hypothetical protein
VPPGERHDDFRSGNVEALTHGATSPRLVAPIAERLADELVAVAPWCAVPAFRDAVESWAWARAQSHLLRAYIDENGPLDDEGRPRPACALLDRVEARADRLRDGFGLTPNAWAKLVDRLGNADAETAARGLAELRAIGAELARALPEGTAHE